MLPSVDSTYGAFMGWHGSNKHSWYDPEVKTILQGGGSATIRTQEHGRENQNNNIRTIYGKLRELGIITNDTAITDINTALYIYQSTKGPVYVISAARKEQNLDEVNGDLDWLPDVAIVKWKPGSRNRTYLAAKALFNAGTEADLQPLSEKIQLINQDTFVGTLRQPLLRELGLPCFGTPFPKLEIGNLGLTTPPSDAATIAKSSRIDGLIPRWTNIRTNQNVQNQLANDSKLCANKDYNESGKPCGKVCARSVDTCNKCGRNEFTVLEPEKKGYYNVLALMLYGLNLNPFSTPDKPADLVWWVHDNLPPPPKTNTNTQCVVVDDALQIMPFHVLAVPTKLYVREWRHLFVNPELGLDLVSELYRSAQEACRRQVSNFLNPLSNNNIHEKNFENYMTCGFNLLPSQAQLHLQALCMPISLNQQEKYEKGEHFTLWRFFPVKYVYKLLLQAKDYRATTDSTYDTWIGGWIKAVLTSTENVKGNVKALEEKLKGVVKYEDPKTWADDEYEILTKGEVQIMSHKSFKPQEDQKDPASFGRITFDTATTPVDAQLDLGVAARFAPISIERMLIPQLKNIKAKQAPWKQKLCAPLPEKYVSRDPMMDISEVPR